MNNIPSAFLTHTIYNDSNKIFFIQLFTSTTDFIGISNINYILDGYQYIPVLSNFSGTNQKWDIYESNKITLSAPSLTLKDFNLPDGTYFSERFYSGDIIGNRCEIFVSYTGLDITDIVKIGSFIVEDAEQNNDEINLRLSIPIIPSTSVNGRLISYVSNSFGTEQFNKSLFNVDESADGKYLPVTFGNQYFAPAVYVGNNNNPDLIYALNDDKYSTLVNTGSSCVPTSSYRFNVDRTEEIFYINNDDYLVPVHKVGWWSGSVANTLGNQYVFTGSKAVDSNPTNTMCVKIYGQKTSWSIGSDKSLFINVPMRYAFIASSSSDNSRVTASLQHINFLFDGYEHSSDTINIPATHWLKINAELNYPHNIQSDGKGIVWNNRLIALPSTTNFDNSTGIICGQTDTTLIVDYYADATASLSNSQATNRLTPNFICGAKQNDYYTKNTYVYGNFSINADKGWITFIDTPTQNNNINTLLYDNATYLGSYSGFRQQNIDYSNNRDTFLKYKKLYSQITLSGSQPSQEIQRAKMLYHMNGGAIDIGEKIGVHVGYGITLKNDSLQSTNNLKLASPIEYAEFILMTKDSESNINANVANAYSNYVNIHGNTRSGSGLTIDTDNEVKLSDFIGDLIKYENFSIGKDYDGTYIFPSFKKSYSSTDVVFTIDYNECSKFSISITPIDKIYSEIVALNTDYNPILETYQISKRWKISDSQYSYSFYNFNNTKENNSLKIDEINKQYTTFVEPDCVTYSGVNYSCLKTNTNVIPTSSIYWQPMASSSYSPSAWSNSSTYYGIDQENESIAKYVLNFYGNRRRLITATTKNPKYLALQIGDVVDVSNCPNTLLGMKLKGFAGNTSTTSVQLNGQTMYSYFMVVGVKKEMKNIEVELLQLAKLDDLEISEVI